MRTSSHDRTDRTSDLSSSPALAYAWIFGAVLTIIGLIGLVLTTSQSNVESLLGFDVNLTHNIVHLASGLAGLGAAAAGLASARIYAIVLGVVYTALALWGFVVGEGFDPFSAFGNINMADNFLHLAIGLLGIGAYVASADRKDRKSMR